MTSEERRWKKNREKAAKLKNPTPQELPSHAWRCQVTVNGKRESVIDDDPEVAHANALALKHKLLATKKKPIDYTVGEAIDKYIETKDSVLSPSTIAGYKKTRENALQDIMKVRLADLTQEQVQRAVNSMAKDHSPKYIKNAHGLLSAALAEFHPDFRLRTTLPQKQKYAAKIPTEKDIQKMTEAVYGTEMELPFLLAVWMGLRASEICGLTWDSIDGDILHVKQARVRGETEWVMKGTKSFSGNRRIRIPPYIKSLLDERPKEGEYIIPMTGQAIYERFSRMCERIGVPHYRFHDLRHTNASVMLAIGVPDKYAMERMGHATNNMLKTVYQHTMQEKQEEVADLVDNYFLKILHTKLHTKNTFT